MEFHGQTLLFIAKMDGESSVSITLSYQAQALQSRVLKEGFLIKAVAGDSDQCN